jgi:hypothetical protein
MHPEMERVLANERIEDLHRHLRSAAAPAPRERIARKVRLDGEVVLRGARDGDRQALASLAALDGTLPPVGPALVAELNGSIAAVLPLDGGRPFADPFQRSAHLIALLEERARQIEEARCAVTAANRTSRWRVPAALRRLV